MRTAIIALATCLGATAAHATVMDFAYTGSLEQFRVPETGEYQILAYGAQGGSNTENETIGPGGLGAKIGGDFALTAGEAVQIAVGGAGTGIGGGGGSFVVGPGNSPLVIAGGGGGGGNVAGIGFSGGDGLTGPNGGTVDNSLGGTNGNGGEASLSIDGGSAGGGGFFTAGGDVLNPFGGSPFATGGGAFPTLAGGTAGGGFGGGGGGVLAGAGGGGYSGGAGGFSSPGGRTPGGGGGSFDAGIDQILVAGFRSGNGEVIITEIAAEVTEPASIALLGVSLFGFATMVRRRARYTWANSPRFPLATRRHWLTAPPLGHDPRPDRRRDR